MRPWPFGAPLVGEVIRYLFIESRDSTNSRCNTLPWCLAYPICPDPVSHNITSVTLETVDIETVRAACRGDISVIIAVCGAIGSAGCLGFCGGHVIVRGRDGLRAVENRRRGGGVLQDADARRLHPRLVR
jgi:hypothetical protein